jgi:hypothetical protein
LPLDNVCPLKSSLKGTLLAGPAGCAFLGGHCSHPDRPPCWIGHSGLIEDLSAMLFARACEPQRDRYPQ